MEVAIGALILGFLCGVLVTYFRIKKEVVGDLRIDTSDPNDNPYLFLELSKNMNVVRSKKYVTFKVNTISYIPHE